MRNRNIKIAIISSSCQESAKVSMELSRFLNIPYISTESTDIIFQEIYNRKSKAYSVSEIYTLILAEFHSRIKKEKNPCFISNGSVLNEIISKKAEINSRELPKSIRLTFFDKILKQKIREFERRVESLIFDYVKDAYDKIYLIRHLGSYKEQYSVLFEKYILEILDDRKINYITVADSSDSSIQEIVKDIKSLN